MESGLFPRKVGTVKEARNGAFWASILGLVSQVLPDLTDPQNGGRSLLLNPQIPPQLTAVRPSRSVQQRVGLTAFRCHTGVSRDARLPHSWLALWPWRRRPQSCSFLICKMGKAVTLLGRSCED